MLDSKEADCAQLLLAACSVSFHSSLLSFYWFESEYPSAFKILIFSVTNGRIHAGQ